MYQCLESGVRDLAQVFHINEDVARYVEAKYGDRIQRF